VEVNNTMGAPELVRKYLESDARSDLLGEMVKMAAELLMDADVDTICNSGYGERSPDRLNSRNGHRQRRWATRAGTIALDVPQLRRGYMPSLLEPRRRAEQALVSVVCQAYIEGVSTRRVDDLVKAMGIDGMSKSQVSELAKNLDANVSEFRNRRLDARSVHLCTARCPLPQGARGRPGRLARDGRERRRPPGDPRCRRHQRRGRGGLDGLSPGSCRTRAVRGRPRRLELPHRAEEHHRGRAGRCGLAVVSHPFHAQLPHLGLEGGPGDSADPGPDELRPARRRPGARPVPPRRRPAARQVPCRPECLVDAECNLLAFSSFPPEHWRQIWSNNTKERLNKEVPGVPTSSASSRTGQPASASSERSSPSRTTSGPSPVAT
jgi:putative transposase